MSRLWPALAFGFLVASANVVMAQTPPPSAPSTPPSAAPPSTPPSTAPSTSPSAAASAPPGSPAPTPAASPSLAPTAPATPPPIVVAPQSAQIGVGATVRIGIQSALGTLTATAADPSIVSTQIDQASQTLFLTGIKPGTTAVTIADGRGLTANVSVLVAYYAGSVPSQIDLRVTGDPASEDFVRAQVVRAIARAATLQPGAQLVLDASEVPFEGSLDQDRIAAFDVPVLLQGTGDLEVDATVHVRVENVAAPRISPASLMVSDYPERLLQNGILFTADLAYAAPSRFLYFHYNPPGQPNRRIVLRAENHSPEPAIVQFIDGRGGPTPNEMEAGHTATKAFLVDVVQNQGRLVTIPANGSVNLLEQNLPAAAIVCSLLQLRVLSGGNVHLTLFAQSADDSPSAPLSTDGLLKGTHPHARGIYAIPEFHYAREWSVTDPYLELPIGQIPLPNRLRGQALAGDYGVIEAFVVNVENPLPSPQAIAIYENPRGGRATGTFLIDGVLLQSHQVPPFSRYKLRQYVVPAHGFVRVTIVTTPEAGSSYPLKLIFAPDDGSVAPGAPGSPIY